MDLARAECYPNEGCFPEPRVLPVIFFSILQDFRRMSSNITFIVTILKNFSDRRIAPKIGMGIVN